MMHREPFQLVLELISSLTPYELGSSQANVILGVSVAVWLVVARLFMGLFNSGRGIFAAFFALAGPLFLGLLAYGMVEWQVVPLIEAEWAEKYLGLGALSLCALLGVMLISGRCFKLSATTGLVIVVFASAAAVGGYIAAKVTLGIIETSTQQIKQRDERNRGDVDSVL